MNENSTCLSDPFNTSYRSIGTKENVETKSENE